MTSYCICCSGTGRLSAKGLGCGLNLGFPVGQRSQTRRSRDPEKFPFVRAKKLPSFGYSLPGGEITLPEETNPILAYDGSYIRDFHPLVSRVYFAPTSAKDRPSSYLDHTVQLGAKHYINHARKRGCPVAQFDRGGCPRGQGTPN